MSDFLIPWPYSATYDRVAVELRHQEVAAMNRSGWLRLAGAGDPVAQLEVRDQELDVTAILRTDRINGSALVAFQNDAKELQVGLGPDDAFRVYDNSSALTPLLLEPGAPTNSLYLDAFGNLGLGTAAPLRELHVRRGADSIVFVRVESTATDSRAGFEMVNDAQRYQVLCETSDHFIARDVTAGTDPLTIEAGALDDSLHVATSGHLGVAGVAAPATEIHVNGALTLNEKTAEPGDPADGRAVIWLTNGTGFGDDGDICAKVNVGGTVKSAVLFDYSVL